MNKENGNENGLNHRQKLMLYPINEVDCGINHVDNISNCGLVQQLTKLCSSLHTSLLMVGGWTKRLLRLRGGETRLRFKRKKKWC